MAHLKIFWSLDDNFYLTMKGSGNFSSPPIDNSLSQLMAIIVI